MIFLFCWMLYRDRFKCLGGTPIHPNVQHSPMAFSPFPVPRKKHVIMNPDLALIHIHSPTGSQTHAWTINSCTAINLAWWEEKIESPWFREKKRRNQQKYKDKRIFYRKGEKKHVFQSLKITVTGVTRRQYWEPPFIQPICLNCFSDNNTKSQGLCLSCDQSYLKSCSEFKRQEDLLHKLLMWLSVLIPVQ